MRTFLYQVFRVAALTLLTSSALFASNNNPFANLWKQHPFYFGPLLGFGSTDWSMLTANCSTGKLRGQDQCNLLYTSAPVSAGDNGWAWGATVGYEVKNFWALESSFIHFPTTTIFFFPEYNIYKENFYLTEIRSQTWALMAVAKFMTQIAESGFRAFANAGIDFTFRNDALSAGMRVNPTFGVGLNYVFPRNIMLELSFQYVAGYGQATIMPAEQYMPFLYAVTAKLLYRI